MSVVLVFIFVVLLLYFVQNYYKILLTGIRIPGPRFIPFIGNIQLLPKLKPQYLHQTLIEFRALYRCAFRFWLGPQLWVFLHTPEETHDALHDLSLKKADSFELLRCVVGNGLLMSQGEEWKFHRKALNPAFHANVIHGFSKKIYEHAAQLINNFNQHMNQHIEISDYLFKCLLDIVVDTSMGVNLKSQADPKCSYAHAFHRTGALLFKRMMNPFLRPDFIFRRTQIYKELQKHLAVIRELTANVIEERAKYLQNIHVDDAKTTPNALLDILLTTKIDGQPLPFQQIQDEVNTFVYAGVDTTAAAMCFMIYALAKYPAEQAKLAFELNCVRQMSKNENFSLQELNELEYMDMFIKEVLRFYTPVPLTGRLTTRETKIGKYHFSAGVTLWINIYGLANDANAFEEPEKFRPQRFSKMTENPIPKQYYLPFFGGPHNCIGKKYAQLIMKILLVKIVENFEVVLSEPNEKLVLMAQMILKSQNGFNVIFKPRNF